MNTGHINAVAALLVASGWAAAQAPFPISSAEPYPPAAQAPGGQRPVAYEPKKEEVPTLPPARSQVATAPPAPLSVSPAPLPASPVYAQTQYNALPAGGYVDNGGARSNAFYSGADFIMWRIKNGSVPSVTAQPPVGVLTVQTFDFNNTLAINGSVGTTVTPGIVGYFPLRIQDVPALPNNGAVNLGESTGGRFNLGYWFSPDHIFGLEASFFFLDKHGQDLASASASSNNQTVYTTPFVDREFTITPGTPGTVGTPSVAGTPGTPATRVQTATFPIFFVRQLDSRVLANLNNYTYGGEVDARSTWFYFGQVAVGGLAGFRYQEFGEDLDVRGSFNLTTPVGVAPTTGPFGVARPSNLSDTILLRTEDTVQCRNNFYGGNIGLDFEGQYCGFFVDLRTKVAMGAMHQRVEINSFTTTTTTGTPLVPAGSTTTAGGLLFNELNNGTHTRNRISFIPEVNLKAGYQFFPWLRGHVGYDAMYLANVIRPGDLSAPLAVASTLQNSSSPSSLAQSNPTVAGTTNIAVSQPSFRFTDSNIWMQGFNFGLELSF